MNTGANIVFVGGVPRSGTTLVQKMLDNHPDVCGEPEFDHLPALCQAYEGMKKGIDNGRQSGYYDLNGLKSAYRQMIDQLLFSAGAKHQTALLSEKTPANALWFSTLNELFPEARFLFVVRDPHAVMLSFQKVWNKAKKTGDPVGVGRNPFADLDLINRYMDRGEAFCRSHAHNARVIHYEELVTDPERQLRMVCPFIGLEYTPEMLDLSRPNETSKLVNDANETVRAWSEPGDLEKPLTTSEIDRWKRELPANIVALVDWRFQNAGIEAFGRYDFENASAISKLWARWSVKAGLAMRKYLG